ncbi:MAG TPA: SRPBCC family protein [Clostridiaceae bacterium]|nr:SRPBCC family protein [Clostridiaceae bacterium]
MEKGKNTQITIETVVHAPVEKVWEYWTEPDHIKKWNNAAEDWFTPSAENDLSAGGKLNWRMEAEDGSLGFDFSGVYDEVKKHELISYTLDDGRKVRITFTPQGGETRVEEVFEAEQTNSTVLQRAGWQAILDNFKRHAEQEENARNLIP